MTGVTLRRVLRFTLHYWLLQPRLFAATIAARILSAGVDVAIPFAAGHFVDTLTRPGDRDLPAAMWGLGLILALGILQFGRLIVQYQLNRLSIPACAAIVTDAFARVQRFSSDWHANAFAGATVRRITRGMWAYDTFTDTVALGLMPTALVVLGVMGVLIGRWPVLGAVVAAAVAVFFVATVALNLRWVRPAFIRSREVDSEASGFLADSVTGNPAVKSFAAEAREDAHLRDLMDRWRDLTLIAWDRGVTTGLVQAALLLLLQASMLGTGLWLWSEGRATPGDLASLISAQFVIGGYMRDIAQHIRNVQRSANEMEDLIRFEDRSAGADDPPGTPDLVVTHGSIQFEAVTFGYAGASAPLYRGLGISIPAGQRVGLVGHSGAGKSTFVKLLQRLYDPQGGRILIDGQDIAAVSRASLRRAVGLVPQDPVLFHRSLTDNIAFGAPGAEQGAVARAAKLAHIATFIESLPDAYATTVGERGIKLSGGERQRVAIARAVLAGAPILVLDEATSSLDSVSERLIRDALERLSAGRTTIVIAHRLSTVRRLDRILVFDAGRIVEDGTHEALMRVPSGFYRSLVLTQADSEVLPAEAAE